MPTANLTWTQADTNGPRIESYKVYRAAGAGDYVLLATLPVDYGNGITDVPVHPLAYSDTTPASDTQYTYRVDAFCVSRQIASNVEMITTPPGGLTFTIDAAAVTTPPVTGTDYFGFSLASPPSDLDTLGSMPSDNTGLGVVACYSFAGVHGDPQGALRFEVAGEQTSDIIVSISFTGDTGTLTFLAADASFSSSSDESDWTWSISPPANIFHDGGEYVITVVLP